MGFGCDCLRRDIFALERCVVTVTNPTSLVSPSASLQQQLQLMSNDAHILHRRKWQL